MQLDAGMLAGEMRHGTCHQLHGARLAAAHPDVALYLRVVCKHLALGAVGQSHDLLRALAQQHTIVGERNPTALAHQQLASKLVLEVGELA